jgi:YD repeat-containing protein
MADVNGNGKPNILLKFSGSSDSIGVVRDDFTTTNTFDTSYTYDANNRQISVTNALGQTQTTSYDAVGQIVATTDALGHATTFGYDNVGNRTSVTDALGNRTALPPIW